MISAEKISELIKNPVLAGQADPSDLAAIRDKFPYCSTLHLLYLKCLAMTNDVGFEDHLRYAAAHVMDRERMYYVVHSGNTLVNEPSATGKNDFIAPVPPALPGDDKHQVIAGAESQGSALISAETEKTRVPEITRVPIDGEAETHETVLPAIGQEEVETTGAAGEQQPGNDMAATEERGMEPIVGEDQDEDPIGDTILPSLLDAAYEQSLGSATPVEPEHEPGDETEGNVIDDPGPGDAIADPQEVVSLSSETEPDLSKLSFVEWLRYRQGKQRPLQEKTAEDRPKRPETIPAAETKPNIQKTEENKRKTLSRTDVDELLNKFIQEEPSISRPKASFYNPVKSARQSLEETPDLVTETLAKIYVLQKNYDKAIRAYEQLILVYPEKKTFFAAQIEKIKEQQNA